MTPGFQAQNSIGVGTLPAILVFAGLTYFQVWGMMEYWQAVLVGIGLILSSARITFRGSGVTETHKQRNYKI